MLLFSLSFFFWPRPRGGPKASERGSSCSSSSSSCCSSSLARFRPTCAAAAAAASLPRRRRRGVRGGAGSCCSALPVVASLSLPLAKGQGARVRVGSSSSSSSCCRRLRALVCCFFLSLSFGTQRADIRLAAVAWSDARGRSRFRPGGNGQRRVFALFQKKKEAPSALFLAAISRRPADDDDEGLDNPLRHQALRGAFYSS